MRKIALVSEHASPMSAIDDVEGADENLFIGQLAKQLARSSRYQIDIFTRRRGGVSSAISQWQPNVRVIHVPAGPARLVPKAARLRMMPAFGEWIDHFFAREHAGYDLVHASGFMSGHAALPVARGFALPLVMSFRSLALGADTASGSPGDDEGMLDRRVAIETQLVREADRIVAAGPRERDVLQRRYGANGGKIDVLPLPQTTAEREGDPSATTPWQRTAEVIASAYETAMGFDRRNTFSLGRVAVSGHPQVRTSGAALAAAP